MGVASEYLFYQRNYVLRNGLCFANAFLYDISPPLPLSPSLTYPPSSLYSLLLRLSPCSFFNCVFASCSVLSLPLSLSLFCFPLSFCVYFDFFYFLLIFSFQFCVNCRFLSRLFFSFNFLFNFRNPLCNLFSYFLSVVAPPPSLFASLFLSLSSY